MIEMNSNTIIVKVIYHHNGLVARKMLIDKNIGLAEFHEKIRSRFGVSADVETEIYYRDDDNDLIIVTFDDELLIALDTSASKFKLVISENNSRVAETSNVDGNVGDDADDDDDDDDDDVEIKSDRS